MDMEQSESRYEQREERDDRDDSPARGKDKERKKSNRSEEKDHRSKERERSRRSGGDEVSKDRSRDSKARDKDHDRDRNREKDRKDRVKEREKDMEKDGRDKERGKEKSNKGRDSEREKEKEKEKEKDKERDRGRERDREREREKHRERERGKDKGKEKERDGDQEKENSRDRPSRKNGEEDHDRSKDVRNNGKAKLESEQVSDALANNKARPSTSEIEDRILRMKEERKKNKPEDGSDMLSWVTKIRKIETKKNVEKQKAQQMLKHLEEQDNIVQEESDDDDDDDEETAEHHHLAGVKVLNGIDKVIEGGAVVFTLKDQNILADGDINEDVDMLENVEIGEQRQRDDAYKAAKKKGGTYVDKFNDDPNLEKRMLPQYDEPDKNEGITLDDKGRVAVEAEKRLEELRNRLNGAAIKSRPENLNVAGKVSSDYFTSEEMLKFKKPKKKKALRKKDKLDIDALEAEAVSAGLGIGDLGSRNEANRRTLKDEKDKAEAEKRDKAYQTAYAKADDASKTLRLEQTLVKPEEDDGFLDDDEDLYKSLARARKIALKKKEETPYGAEAVARLATANTTTQTENEQNPDPQGNKVVLSEMEEYVWSLPTVDETQKHDDEDVFMGEAEEPKVSEVEVKDESGGWSEVKDEEMEENPSNEPEEEAAPDVIIHEAAVGKGLSGALRLLQDRGALKETVDWGGRNMDKKKSKLVGIVSEDEPKNEPKKAQQTRQRDSKEFVYHERDIHIERTDEFGRILTPKEAFRQLSHKFHGKLPGKMKQEKRMKQYEEELKLKQMKSSDTPSMSVERMREAQAQLKTPYLVLSGHVKSGQTSDPSSGFATVNKDLPGGLTPMLGDRKVEHFLGIKRKPEPSNLGPSKKTKA